MKHVGRLALVVVAGLLAACTTPDTISDATPTSLPSRPSTAECRAAVDHAVARLQDVIDEFADVSVVAFNERDEPLDVSDVQAAVEAELQAAADRGCVPVLLEQWYRDALEQLRGDGAVGQAVAAALRGDGPVAGPLPPERVPAPTVPAPDCLAAVDDAVSLLQAHVDQFGEFTIEEYLALDPPPDVTPIVEQIQDDLQAMADQGCDADALNDAFDARVEGITGVGPVGTALAAGLRGDEPPADQPTESASPAAGDGPAPTNVGPVATPIPLTAPPRVPTAIEDLRVHIASLPSGARLELPAGTYRISEPIVIDKSLTIVGAGRGATVIESTAPGAAMVFLGPGDLSVSGLTLRHVGNANASLLIAIEGAVTISGVAFSGGRGSIAQGSGSGLVFGFEPIDGFPARTAAQRGGALTITDSVFRQNAGAGIMVIGPAAPVITGSEFSDNGACGVCLVSDATGTIRSSTFSGNGAGAQADGVATLSVSGSTFGPHRVAAVVLTQRATGTVTDNTVTGGGVAGMQFLGESTATVRGNRLGGSSTVCLSIIGSATASVEGNTTDGCRIGIQAAETARPTITGNTVGASAEVGIYVGGDATGSVRGNTVTGNGDVGIQITDRATSEVASNRVSGAGRVGVVYWSAAGGTFTTNTVSGFTVGMQIGEDATPTVSGNTFSGSTEAVLLATGRTTATLRDNQFAGTGPIGVQVAASGAPTIASNRITGSGTVGLLYLGASTGTASSNHIGGWATGVQLGGTATPSLLGNRVVDSRVASIQYFESSGGPARENVCEPAAGAGILLTTNGATSLGANQCSVSSQG